MDKINALMASKMDKIMEGRVALRCSLCGRIVILPQDVLPVMDLDAIRKGNYICGLHEFDNVPDDEEEEG